MGNKHPQNIEKEDYENCCKTFKDFLSKLKNELDLEKVKNTIVKKIDEKTKKNLVFKFIENYLEKEKKEKILNKMQEIFVYLFEHYEKIHRKEQDKFSDYVDNNEKNIINAIYISKILEDEIDDEDDKFMIMLFIYMVKIVLMKLKMETIKILMKILKTIKIIILSQQKKKYMKNLKKSVKKKVLTQKNMINQKV